jgi:hypothetical protein
MTDRYEDLMTRLEALGDECYGRMQATRDRICQTAPLVPMSWRSSGAVLSPDGRLSVEVEEFDEYHRRRHYCLWSELDGTIREMPAPAGGEEQVVFSPDPRLGAGGKDPGRGELSTLARRYLGQAAADAWLSLLSPASAWCTLSPAIRSSPSSAACPRCPSIRGRSGRATVR